MDVDHIFDFASGAFSGVQFRSLIEIVGVTSPGELWHCVAFNARVVMNERSY